ncbi:hypothetical protein VTN77DRAFT_3888 [Rasamsonia byssochlamydoides]|uniref:uncharacterized protein n=1 Tax=Rasamsonia byssochlamydoides TaxID=89139 RepID=UPI00374237DC
MPADYESTARALSLPVSSPEESDTPLFASIRPPWSQSPVGRRGSLPISAREAATFRDRIINQAQSSWRSLRKRWEKMTLWQKVLAVSAFIFSITLGLGFMAFTGQVFVWLGPVAEKWEDAPLAYILLWMGVFTVSFPPLVGWSTLGTVIGFVFGFWKGWLVYATATVVGSTCAFVVSRTVLSKFVHRLMEHDKRFAALALTLKYDGLKLLCMIRLCPLPYSICNGAISTFPTVHPLRYGLATVIISPKLLVPAFIGSRLRVLSESGGEMSAGSKAVNIISIIVSISIGIGTGIYIYRRTLARAKQLEAEERAGIRQSLHDDHAAHRSHRAFSDDPEANVAATTLARDEEGHMDFDEDNIDIVVEGDDDNDEDTSSGKRPYNQNNKAASYRDKFTDNDSDVFRDGDGDTETYGLHTHVRG